ncbi:MAG: hydrogenase maturation nickel metallochaperone HypA [Gemmatimonadales bacterium]|nr:hydrogenase maturation nickel metallochaperone HypA [Gemmatimonadales bacterium]
MHELSIVYSVVAAVEERAREMGATKVTAVSLRIGALAGVVPDALRFSYDVGTAGTLLEGSALSIEERPVVIHCARCDRDVTIEGIQRFRCPTCDTPSADIRQGREMELVSFEVESAP